MNLSGDILLSSIYYKGSLPTNYWEIDTKLVDVKRGFIYTFQSQNSGTNFTVERYDLDMNFVDEWDGDLQTPIFKEGITKGVFLTLSEDKSKIICAISLGTDPTNTSRFGYIDIDYDDFPNSPVTYSSGTITVSNNWWTKCANLFDNGDLLYSFDVNRNSLRFNIYNIDTNSHSILNSGINARVIDQKFDYNSNQLHCIVNLKNTTLMQYWVYDYNTTTIIYQSSSFDTNTLIPNRTPFKWAYLLDVRKSVLEICYWVEGDTNPSIALFNKSMTLLANTKKEINISIPEGFARFLIIQKLGNGEYYVWFNTNFNRATMSQVNSDKPLFSGDVSGGIQINNTIPLL